jgi:hypothetical protein
MRNNDELEKLMRGEDNQINKSTLKTVGTC